MQEDTYNMNKWGKKLMIAGLCACMAATALGGCSPKADTAIATLNGTDVPYGVASFMVRYSQAQMQSMYGSYLGTDYWSSYGESSRDSVMESLEQMLILEQHMDEYNVTITDEEKSKISEAAQAFIENNDEDMIKAMAVDQETVERALTLYTVQTKMRQAIIADVDTEVSDEEAAQKTIEYALFSTAGTTDEEGNTTEMTDEEKAQQKDQAQQVLDLVKGGQDLESSVQSVDAEMTTYTASYGTDNGSIPDEVKEAADQLSDGECADSVVETDDGYYVIVMQSTFDEEATETQKENIVAERQDEKFNEVYDAWREEADFAANDKVVEKITFQDTYQLETEETEASTETEAATDTEASTDTEAAADTEASAQTESESASAQETESQSESETFTESESQSE